MALLQWSDVRAMWTFNAPDTILFRANGVVVGGSPTIFSVNPPRLFTEPTKDVTANFQNADSGYRASYGRYYRNLETTTDVLWTAGGAPEREVWDGAGTPLINFTYGFVFRDISSTNARRWVMSKPTIASAGGVFNEGNLLQTNADGDFQWICHNDAGAAEVANIDTSDYEKDVWYIGYVIKADGVQSKLGLKKKGSGSWITANSGAVAITVDYATGLDAALLSEVDAGNVLANPWRGDLQAFCIWGVAITESTVQSDLEDHFGIADIPAAAMTLGGGMGAMQGLGRRKGRGY